MTDTVVAPAFVLSCHRSGSTLLRYLLDAHPAIACPPETKFIAGIEQAVLYPQAVGALATIGVSTTKLMAHFRRMCEDILGDYCRSRGKRRWVDKTPNYYRLIPLLEQLFAGEARYIFLSRHPVDNVASLVEMFPHGASLEDPDIRAAHALDARLEVALALYWRTVNETLLEWRATNPSRVLLVRYESLVRSPLEEMAGVFAFLGEEMPDDLLKGVFDGRQTQGYEDPKIRHSTCVYTSSVGRGNRLPNDVQCAIWHRAQPIAAQLGYQRRMPMDNDERSVLSILAANGL